MAKKATTNKMEQQANDKANGVYTGDVHTIPPDLPPANVEPDTGEVLDADPAELKAAEQKALQKAPKPAAKTGEIVVQTPEAAMAIVGGVTTETLEKALKIQTDQRKLIKQFVEDHLENGVDFGTIHVVKREKCPNQYTCTNKGHFSKPVLFKPGQEKLFSLFQITSKLVKDEEAYEMLPDTRNLVAYKCIMERNDKQIGEGRGSATVGDKGRDVNATIKIAEKRARMDACLSLGFSEYFAQDLDDADYKTQAEQSNLRAAAEAEAREMQEPANNSERAQLAREFNKANYPSPDDQLRILEDEGVQDPKKMTRGKIREIIRKFQAGEIEPNLGTPDSVVNDIPDEIDPNDFPDGPPAEDTTPPEPQLVVDDELKTNIQELYGQIGLNDGFGKQWFMKRATGRPFARWEQFDDQDWRQAYQAVMDILETKIPVEDRYLDPDHKTGTQPSLPISNKPYKE